MNNRTMSIIFFITGILCLFIVPELCAAASGKGVGAVANEAKLNLSGIAGLVTAGSYVGGMAFGVASIVKFKAHKDNPTQIHISQAISLLFVSAALLFLPSVFKSTGLTLYSSGGKAAGISGFSSF
jgi:intracellular multiplication protein IcmD